MFLHLKTLGRMASVAYSPGRTATHEFSLRRAAYFTAFGGLHTALFSVTSAGRGLDRLLSPSFAKTDVAGPLFVVATPRCGTTLTHRLLSLDEERFCEFKLFETVFPSVSIQRVLDRAAAVDGALGHPVEKLVERLNAFMSQRWQDIHPLDLTRSEEDESLFVYTLLTPAAYMLLPFVDALPELTYVDRAPANVRSKLVAHYRESVQRHLFLRGRGRMALIKNVLLAGRMQIAQDAFPDARFVHLVRHPFEAIPSALSLFYAVWEAHSPGIAKDSPEIQQLAKMFVSYYRDLCEWVKKAPPGRAVTVRYEDLVRDPTAAIQGVYEQLGFDMSVEYRQRLEEQAARDRRFHSKHAYSLEEFGLDPASLYRELADVFETFGYDAPDLSRAKSDALPQQTV